MNLNIEEGRTITINLKTIVKGPQSVKDNFKSLMLGFANYNIDTSHLIKAPFGETDYDAELSVVFKKEQGFVFMESVSLKSVFNGMKAVDITNHARATQSFQKSVIQEYLL